MKSKILVCAVIFGAFAFGGANSGGEKKPASSDEGEKIELPAALRVKPREAKPGEEELRKLMIARYNIALLEAQKRLGEDGRFNVRLVIGASDQCIKRLFEAELALTENAQQRAKACSNYLELARFLEEGVAANVKGGARQKDPAGLESCRYLRADAEVRVFEAKRQAGVK